MDDTISRAAALDTLNGIEISRNASWYEFYQRAITAVETLPSTCHLLEDGTLIVKVQNLSAVHRVIVDAEDSQYCKTFYQDGDDNT